MPFILQFLILYSFNAYYKKVQKFLLMISKFFSPATSVTYLSNHKNSSEPIAWYINWEKLNNEELQRGIKKNLLF